MTEGDQKTVHPSDPPRRFLATPGGKLAYSVEGAGPKILLIHGLPGSLRDFRWLAPHLTDGAQVIRVDLPGFGQSDPVCPFERGPLAQLLLRLCDALEISHFSLMGHSFGAQLAAKVAARAPERVVALGLLAAPGLVKHRGAKMIPTGPVRAALASPRWAPHLQPMVKKAFLAAGFPRSLPFEEIEKTMEILSRWRFTDNAAVVDALRCPVLGAWALDDKLVQPKITEAMLARCPPGPRLCFSQGGHGLQKSQARAISEAFLTLIAAQGASRAAQ